MAAATEAPDPGGNEFAAVQLPPAGKEFGFSDLFNTFTADTGALAGFASAGGANAVRMPLDWWGLELTRDLWNEVAWARTATAYDLLLARGIKPHLILANAPPWARDAGTPTTCLIRSKCNFPPAAPMLGEWRQFAGEVARRFPQATLEIWNEPNSLGQWRSGVDPARYANVLVTAYDAIKAVNPSQQVLMGGLAESVGPESMHFGDFLRGAYAATPSLKGHTDAINFHTYQRGNMWAGSPFAETFATVRSVRAEFGDETTPLFISETGQTTTGDDGVSEADQADQVLRMARKMLTMPDVSGVLVHSLVDQVNLPLDRPEREVGFGMLAFDELGLPRPKRAFCELSRAAGAVYPGCPPLARIIVGPQGWHTSSSATFQLASTEPASFRCSLDGAALTSCGSSVTYTSLSEGAHQFAVQAVNALGGSDPEPITRTFTVDTVAPETSLWGPNGPIAVGTARVAPSSPDPTARLECSMNGAQYASCQSSVDLGPLADGSYVVRARAVDPAGNVDQTPASVTFTVDTRAPRATITSGPSGKTTQREPRFEFTADEQNARHLCAFNGLPLGECRAADAHWTMGPLVDGTYSFQVVAIDAAGNRGPVVSRSFEVDTKGPTSQISGVPNPTRDSTPTFSLTSPEQGATFECRFDSADFASCGASVTAASLADGFHAIDVRALDGLGNRGLVVRFGFYVDTRVPQVAFTAGPPALSNLASITLGFQADEGGSSFECSLDGDAFAACQSPLTIADPGDGGHTFRVRASDRAGNVGPPASRQFSIDRIGPTTEITAGVSGPTQWLSPTFSFSTESGASIRCRFDAEPFGQCATPSSHRPAAPLGEGPHSFEVRATDQLGNMGPTATRSFTVDRTAPPAPGVTIANLIDGRVGAVAHYQASGLEPGSSVECRLDAGAWAGCPSQGSYEGLSAGVHLLYARSTDAAGNVSGPGEAQFEVDLTAPTVSAQLAKSRARSVVVALTSDDPEARFEIKLDRKRSRVCPAICKLKDLHRGGHAITAWAVDAVANRSASPARLRFRIRQPR